MNTSNNPQPPATRQIKLAMSVVVVMLSVLVYAFFSERTPNETDPAALGLVFVSVAVLSSIVGFWMASQARSGQHEKAVIAAANFEVVALLAFMYVGFINTEVELWISPLVGVYSLAMIWLVVPDNPTTPDPPASVIEK